MDTVRPRIVDIKGVTDATGVCPIWAPTCVSARSSRPTNCRPTPWCAGTRASGEAAAQTSAPALRRRATVGGNITTPHAAGDITTALLALDAMVVVADRQSCDHSPLADFMSAQAAGGRSSGWWWRCTCPRVQAQRV
ncbi:MAG: FAD binding domain-containing protein [Acidobacteria bacterium]|nr:FAD binding domain-containing protein [Acidobacteriota bacterium]